MLKTLVGPSLKSANACSLWELRISG